MTDQPSDNKQTESSAEKNKNSNKKVLIIIGCVFGGLLILGIIGTIVAGYLASKVAETAFESATGTNIELERDGTGEVTFKGDNGEEMKVTTATELPDGFPEAVPIYEGAKIVSAQTLTLQEDATTYTVIAETGDSMKSVDDFYSAKLGKDAGWKNMSKSTSSEVIRLMSTNKAKDLYLMLSVSKDSDTGKTTINITTRNKAEL